MTAVEAKFRPSFITVADAREKAHEVLEPRLWSLFFGDHNFTLGTTSAANEAAWRAVELRPRMMVDVTSRSLATTVQGQPISFPVMVAPLGGLLRFHKEGDLAAANAARDADTLMCLSTSASATIEEIAASGARRWFQLYVMDDPKTTELLVRRAEQAGYGAIVITVDNYANFRGLSVGRADHSWLGEDPRLPNFRGMDIADQVTGDNFQARKSLKFTWADLAWVRSLTSLPIILKGIVTAEDAVLAAHYGVNGIVVSNHGGHALASSIGTAPKLLEVVTAVGSQMEVYVDGGIRRGTDVIKALALGARAVLIGRAMAWGLTAAGEIGVRSVLEILRDELYTAMGLCGVTDVHAVPSSLVTFNTIRPELVRADG